VIRIFAIFSVATVLVAAVIVPLTLLQPGAFVLGGHYHITAGEALNEDISFYFAQVTIDEGAKVDGHIFLYSSTLDLRGDVTENIHAFESDLTLRASARVEGEIDEKDLIHWTLLLPAMTQLP
jgi:hypothetical protein